jgi:hypothetical protein
VVITVAALATGAIVGIVIGVVLCIGLAGGGAYGAATRMGIGSQMPVTNNPLYRGNQNIGENPLYDRKG